MSAERRITEFLSVSPRYSVNAVDVPETGRVFCFAANGVKGRNLLFGALRINIFLESGNRKGKVAGWKISLTFNMISHIIRLKRTIFSCFMGKIRQKGGIVVEGQKKVETILSEMIRIPTVRGVPEKYKMAAYRALLEEEFPHVFSVMEKTPIEEALLLKWEGKDPSQLPVLLSGHMDVVDADEEGWEYPPFEGVIAENQVWGRGALDMKGAQCAFLYALEEKCRKGETPERTLYVYLSCDEEVGGDITCSAVEYLKEKGVRLQAVFDEGGTLAEEYMDCIPGRSAVIAIAEKGSLTYEVTALGKGGHSANPGSGTAIARLSAFICSLEENPPFLRELPEEQRACLRAAARYMQGEKAKKFAAAAEEQDPAYPILHTICDDADARLGVTVAFTKIEGGHSANVLPEKAVLTMNVRVPASQPEKDVTRLLEERAGKFDVSVKMCGGRDASAVTSVDGWAYRYTEEILGRVFPGMPVIPFVLGGGTDSRHFLKIAEEAVRFSPIYIRKEQGSGVHGKNERIDVRSLYESVEYYREFLKNL